MSNLDQKIENVANKIEFAANKAWKKRSFRIVLILSILVDTFLSRISLTMLPAPNLHNTSCVLS